MYSIFSIYISLYIVLIVKKNPIEIINNKKYKHLLK